MYVDGYGKCPSVSLILDSVGISQLPIIPLKGVPIEEQCLATQAIMNQAARKGTLVHYATECDDLGYPAWWLGDDDIEPYVDSWRGFKQQYGYKPSEDQIETKFGMTVEEANLLKYCGIVDRHGRLNGEGNFVVEIKRTSTLPFKTVFQLSAYKKALLSLGRYDSLEIGAVVLKENGRAASLKTFSKDREAFAMRLFENAHEIVLERFANGMN